MYTVEKIPGKIKTTRLAKVPRVFVGGCNNSPKKEVARPGTEGLRWGMGYVQFGLHADEKENTPKVTRRLARSIKEETR